MLFLPKAIKANLRLLIIMEILLLQRLIPSLAQSLSPSPVTPKRKALGFH
jgi:hypothetical protein